MPTATAHTAPNASIIPTGRVGEIVFGASHVSVYSVDSRGRRSLIGMLDYAPTDCVAQVVAVRAARHFGAHLPASARRLRHGYGGCEVPGTQDARFGWTREARGYGAVSIIRDIYYIM